MAVKKETFMRGVLSLMLSQVFVKLLGVVYRVYLTNREGFGDKGNAIFGAGYNIYILLLSISSIGIPSAISKLVSEKLAVADNIGAHRIFKISFFLFAIIGLVGTLGLIISAKYIATIICKVPEAEYTLVALSPSIFFVTIVSVFRGYFTAREQISVNAKSQTYEQLYKAIFTILLVEVAVLIFGTNTTIMAIGANLSTTISTGLGFAYIYRYYIKSRREIWQDVNSSVMYKQESKREIIKKILFMALPISLSSILISINRIIDNNTVIGGLMTFMSYEAATVQYGILNGKVDILTTLPLSFNIAFSTALVPALATAMKIGDTKTAIKRVSFSMLITTLIGLPCTAGLVILSQPILNLMYPGAPDGATLLAISSLAIIFAALTQTINGALQGLGKAFVSVVALGIGVLAKVVLNKILIPIPLIGANGAAMGSVICNIIAFTISYSVLTKNLKLNLSISKFLIKPIIATVMMSVCTISSYFLFSRIIDEKFATIVSLIISVIIYLLAIIVLRILRKEDIYMMPFGEKVYKILIKLGIYKEEEMQSNQGFYN